MNPIDIRFLKMKFSFESETGEIEDHRFINKFMIDIYGCNMLDNHQLEKPAEVLIGKAVVYQFLLEYMIREDFPYMHYLPAVEKPEMLGIYF